MSCRSTNPMEQILALLIAQIFISEISVMPLLVLAVMFPPIDGVTAESLGWPSEACLAICPNEQCLDFSDDSLAFKMTKFDNGYISRPHRVNSLCASRITGAVIDKP